MDTQNPTGYAQVISETFSGGSGSNRELSHAYVYGLERISQFRSFLANNQSQTQISFYAYDGHGSVRALTSSTGAVTDTYDYDAFGNLLHSTGTTFNEFLFAAEQFDSDLNLYYNRARYLNVSIGRFWTMDTFEGDGESPLSLHKYLYSNGDPTDVVDPSGHDGADLAFFIFAVGVIGTMLDAINFLQHRTVMNGVNLAIDVVLIPEVVVKAVTAVVGTERAASLLKGILSSTRAIRAGTSEARAVQYWAGLGITVAAKGETALEAMEQGGKAVDLILQTRLGAPVILNEAKSTLTAARLEETLIENGGKFANTISALQKAGSDYKGVERIVITYDQLGNLGKDWQVLGDGYVRYRGAIQYVNGIPVEAIQIAH